MTITLPSGTTGVSYTVTGKVTKIKRTVTPRMKASLEMKVSVGQGTSASPPVFGVGDMSQPLDVWQAAQGTTANYDNWDGTWHSDYLGLYDFTQNYPAPLIGSFAFADVLYVVGAQPVVEYVDATLLSTPSYAVTGVSSCNQSAEQIAAVRGVRAARNRSPGRDPRQPDFLEHHHAQLGFRKG